MKAAVADAVEFFVACLATTALCTGTATIHIRLSFVDLAVRAMCREMGLRGGARAGARARAGIGTGKKLQQARLVRRLVRVTNVVCAAQTDAVIVGSAWIAGRASKAAPTAVDASLVFIKHAVNTMSTQRRSRSWWCRIANTLHTAQTCTITFECTHAATSTRRAVTAATVDIGLIVIMHAVIAEHGGGYCRRRTSRRDRVAYAICAPHARAIIVGNTCATSSTAAAAAAAIDIGLVPADDAVQAMRASRCHRRRYCRRYRITYTICTHETRTVIAAHTCTTTSTAVTVTAAAVDIRLVTVQSAINAVCASGRHRRRSSGCIGVAYTIRAAHARTVVAAHACSTTSTAVAAATTVDISFIPVHLAIQAMDMCGRHRRRSSRRDRVADAICAPHARAVVAAHAG
jgi:hypothetical protein